MIVVVAEIHYILAILVMSDSLHTLVDNILISKVGADIAGVHTLDDLTVIVHGALDFFLFVLL